MRDAAASAEHFSIQTRSINHSKCDSNPLMIAVPGGSSVIEHSSVEEESSILIRRSA